MKRMKPKCAMCRSIFSAKRKRAGYDLCMTCGDGEATRARKFWCVATMHKSNSVLVTDPADLIGINNKGGLVR